MSDLEARQQRCRTRCPMLGDTMVYPCQVLDPVHLTITLALIRLLLRDFSFRYFFIRFVISRLNCKAPYSGTLVYICSFLPSGTSVRFPINVVLYIVLVFVGWQVEGPRGSSAATIMSVLALYPIVIQLPPPTTVHSSGSGDGARKDLTTTRNAQAAAEEILATSVIENDPDSPHQEKAK